MIPFPDHFEAVDDSQVQLLIYLLFSDYLHIFDGGSQKEMLDHFTQGISSKSTFCHPELNNEPKSNNAYRNYLSIREARSFVSLTEAEIDDDSLFMIRTIPWSVGINQQIQDCYHEIDGSGIYDYRSAYLPPLYPG